MRYDVLDFAMIFTSDAAEGVRALIVDLGLGGLAVRTNEPVALMEKLRIVIGQTSGTPFEVTGVVRYCEARKDSPLYAVGLQFDPASHEERIRIAKLINYAFQRSCQPA